MYSFVWKVSAFEQEIHMLVCCSWQLGEGGGVENRGVEFKFAVWVNSLRPAFKHQANTLSVRLCSEGSVLRSIGWWVQRAAASANDWQAVDLRDASGRRRDVPLADVWRQSEQSRAEQRWGEVADVCRFSVGVLSMRLQGVSVISRVYP